jgi:tellurite methyltransferase
MTTASRSSKHAVRFFEDEFRRRLDAGQDGLHSRELLAAPFLRGAVLDMGCGLGNLSLLAAANGCDVTAVDACRVAVARVRREARRRGLRLRVVAADLADFEIEESYDTVLCIGVLIFFRRSVAHAILRRIQGAVVPGGVVAVSVLTEGTTYMDMFDISDYHLFAPDEVRSAFRGWDILADRDEEAPAPHNTRKTYSTIVARCPAA